VCVHMRPGFSGWGPSMIHFPHTTLLQPILSQSWAKTSESLGRISSSEFDPQSGTLQIIDLFSLLLTTVLVVPCALFQHPTSYTLLIPPNPCQRELVCGACIGTAQVGAYLAAPLDSLFKRSSLRSLRDIIIVLVTFINIMPVRPLPVVSMTCLFSLKYDADV